MKQVLFKVEQCSEHDSECFGLRGYSSCTTQLVKMKLIQHLQSKKVEDIYSKIRYLVMLVIYLVGRGHLALLWVLSVWVNQRFLTK